MRENPPTKDVARRLTDFARSLGLNVNVRMAFKGAGSPYVAMLPDGETMEIRGEKSGMDAIRQLAGRTKNPKYMKRQLLALYSTAATGMTTPRTRWVSIRTVTHSMKTSRTHSGLADGPSVSIATLVLAWIRPYHDMPAGTAKQIRAIEDVMRERGISELQVLNWQNYWTGMKVVP